MLLMRNDRTVKVFGRWEVVDEKRHVIARPVKPSLNLLPSPDQAVRA